MSALAPRATASSWAILSGADPSVVLARASEPLLYPTAAWEAGVAPFTCNVPNVIFLEAAAVDTSDGVDTFRVYYGGSDAVVGTAVVQVKLNSVTVSGGTLPLPVAMA
jgi:predicted GH43/DUF377 family glycosyl hydrolase